MARTVSLFLLAATPWLASVSVADHPPIAGYTPASNVVPHSELDLDMTEIDEKAGEGNFTGAYTRYELGLNSEKGESIRTIQGFSKGAEDKLKSEKWFEVYSAYWDNPEYADEFTTSACLGQDDFEDASDETREECCVKGAQYQNIWMYVIHELEDAIDDCKIGELDDNDGGPHAWDEGWAFYAGSLEGTEGTGEGVMVYALAEKRCLNFATCTADDDGSDIEGRSAVNAELLELFKQGQVHLLAGECDDADAIKDKIVDVMTVPLVQGLLKYLYEADPDAGDGEDKESAELWAFAASVLPRINECDEDVATTIKDNTDITSDKAPVSEGYVLLKEKLESVYSCLGITCAQVGGYVIAESARYHEGLEPCSDGDDGLNKGEVAGIVIAVVAVLAIIGGVVLCKRRNKRKTAQAMSSDLGGFGNKATGTL